MAWLMKRSKADSTCSVSSGGYKRWSGTQCGTFILSSVGCCRMLLSGLLFHDTIRNIVELIVVESKTVAKVHTLVPI